MDAAKVVVHMKQIQHSDVIFELLAESIRQPCEPPHIHPHVEILSLNVGRADMLRPAIQKSMSLLCASIAVNVQTSPQIPASILATVTFFCLHPTNDQISSTCTRFAVTLRTMRSWYSMQAAPTATRSRRTAPLDTPVRRTVERTEQPSTSAERTATFFSKLLTFAMI